METKELENTNIIPRRSNVGKCVDRLKTKFGGVKYDTQFRSTGKEKNILCTTYTN